MKFEQIPEYISPDSSKEKHTLEAILKRTPNFLGFVAALAASTTAFAQEYEANQVEVIVRSVTAESPQVESLTKERFGVSLYEVCKKSGCQVRVEKPSQNGKYIIHMGQVHARPPVEMLISGSADKVLDSQQIIYNTLKKLDNPTVFVEGLTPDSEILIPKNKEETKESLFSQDELLLSKSFGIREYQNYVVKKYNIDVKYEKFNSYIIPEAQEDSIKAVAEIEVDSIEDADLRKKITSIKKTLEISSFDFKGQIDYGYSLPFHKDYDKSALFALGATHKLSLDGKVMTVLPGETNDLNDLANGALESSGVDSIDFAKAQNSRDNYVVSNAVASGDNFPIIVYGAAHDFENNLENNNASKYGIIRIRTSHSEEYVEAEGEELFAYVEPDSQDQEGPGNTLKEAIGKAFK